MGLGEDSAVQSEDPEEQQAAIQQLQELVGQHFPAGVDGSNAIESLAGLIEDPQLDQAIKQQAQQDPDSCVRGLVKDWLEQNAPEALEQLDFGDYVEEPAEVDPNAAPADGQEVPQEEPVPQEGQDQAQPMNVQDLAEFIHSFYDRDSGSFPKGPEGVAVMVGKKFGEQAEQAARKMIERMAPHQSTEQNPDLQELMRIKELASW